MKKLFWIISLQIAFHFASAQKRNAIWCFGDSAGIDFNDTLNPQTFTSGMNSKGSCSTICDSSGNLLFYCSAPDIVAFWNGVYPLGIVYNRNHQMMLNGDSLNCIAWYHEMEIVPMPGNPNQYYVFHIGVTGLYGLYYSIVDMTQDSGRGAVISKNNQLNNYIAQDCLQAVKHGNGRDWWVIFHSPTYSDSFYIYSVDTSGVQLHHIDTMGIRATTNAGDLRFNSNGTQFAFCNWRGALVIYNFDRCSGQILLNKIIHTEDLNGIYPYFFDVCFSPNDSLLYLSCEPYASTMDTTQQYVYQLKLWLQNPYPTRYVVYNPVFPLTPVGLRLGPDKRIYIATVSIYTGGYPYDSTYFPTEATNLSVITQPNNMGAACNFQPFSFYLGGKRAYMGFPNNPNYDLPALGGSLCDTLGYPNGISEYTEERSLSVYPNPFTSTVIFNSGNVNEVYTIQIFNITGKKVYSGKCFSSGEVNLSFLENGIYIVKLSSGNKYFQNKIVKMDN